MGRCGMRKCYYCDNGFKCKNHTTGEGVRRNSRPGGVGRIETRARKKQEEKESGKR